MHVNFFDYMGERDLCSENISIFTCLINGGSDEARKLLDEMSTRHKFSWPMMVSGYVNITRQAMRLSCIGCCRRVENWSVISFSFQSFSRLLLRSLGKEVVEEICPNLP